MPAPNHPKIYHITHVDNLPAIIGTKKLLSDAEMMKSGGPNMMVGMARIKERRLTKIRLDECYPDDFVGEYVPFYFCPRSVMLYLISKRNAELTYQGGQGPIVHLEADLHKVIAWAEERNRKWAFSLSNAGAYGVEFRNELDKLDEIHWPSVAANSWGNSNTKHLKQESSCFTSLSRGTWWIALVYVTMLSRSRPPKLLLPQTITRKSKSSGTGISERNHDRVCNR